MLRPKINCEICGMDNSTILHRHHIIPRKDPRSTNNAANISILCPNCHFLVHSGELIIIGVYSTTDGIKSLWFKKGEKPPLPKEFWHVKDNPLVITMGGSIDDLQED